MYTKLKNMKHGPKGEVYLKSDDVKEMAQQVIDNLAIEETTDSGFEIQPGDTLSLQNLLENMLKKQKVSTENFTEAQWESVLWNDDWSRPDKVTGELNRAFERDANDSKHLKIKSDYEQTKGFLGIFGKMKERGLFNFTEKGNDSKMDTELTRDLESKLLIIIIIFILISIMIFLLIQRKSRSKF